MLVMRGGSLSKPILGFNVIEQMLKNSVTEQLDATGREQLHETLRVAFPSLEKEDVTGFIDLVSSHVAML